MVGRSFTLCSMRLYIYVYIYRHACMHVCMYITNMCTAVCVRRHQCYSMHDKTKLLLTCAYVREVVYFSIACYVRFATGPPLMCCSNDRSNKHAIMIMTAQPEFRNVVFPCWLAFSLVGLLRLSIIPVLRLISMCLCGSRSYSGGALVSCRPPL